MDEHKLNLGCGKDYHPGWENWDRVTRIKTDRCFDFTRQKFPVERGYFSEIFCGCLLQQLERNEDLLHVLNESWRALREGGTMTVLVPNVKKGTGNQDPYDVRKFTEETFHYFDKTTPEYERYGVMYGFLPWTVEKIFTNKNGIIEATLRK